MTPYTFVGATGQLHRELSRTVAPTSAGHRCVILREEFPSERR